MSLEKKPSLIANYIYNVIYEIFIIIIPFITASYTARIFNPDGIGVFSFTNNIASFAVLFGSLGIASYGQREIARNRDNKQKLSKTFFELISLNVITMTISLIIYYGISFYPSQYSQYMFAFSILVIAGIFDISWFYRGVENFRFVTILQIFIKVLTLILLFSFIKTKDDLLLYVVLFCLSTFLGNICMWFGLKKYLIKPIEKIKPFSHFKNTFMYFIPTIATSVYTTVDKLMIGMITKDDFENGYYEQATKIVNMCKGLILSINTVMSARMSYLFEIKKTYEIQDKMKKTMNFVLLISVPITLGLISVSSDFVPLFFGTGYDKVVILLYILVPLLFFVGISNVYGSCYFVPSGQRARSSKIIVAAAVINCTLNFFLIYFFKSVGACISSLIAEVFIAVCYIYMGNEWLSFKEILKNAWKKFVSAILMSAIVFAISYFTPTNWGFLILEIFSGALLYFIVLLILKDNSILFCVNKVISLLKRRVKNDRE